MRFLRFGKIRRKRNIPKISTPGPNRRGGSPLHIRYGYPHIPPRKNSVKGTSSATMKGQFF